MNAYEKYKIERKANTCAVDGCDEWSQCSHCNKCQKHHDEEVGYVECTKDEEVKG